MGLSSFASKIKDYCAGKNLLSGVSCLIVGLSGGPDSVALLLALEELRRKEGNFPLIYAVHVNHGIRATSKDDEKLACNLCLKLEIPFTTYEFDCVSEAKSMGRGLEETGRILRYMSFNERAKEIAIQNGVDEASVKIVTAHHKGDLTETFMMNLFRGAGLEGLVAFSDSKDVIRPLLCVSKTEILSYLDSLNEPFAVDETNSDSSYTRNKWRNEILPLIAETSVKTPEDAILSTNQLLATDSDYLRIVVDEKYSKAVRRVFGQVFLSIEAVCDFHDAIKNRIIRRLWEETFGNLIDFESTHVVLVSELIKGVTGTKYTNLAFGRLVLATDRYFGFCTETSKSMLACAMATEMGFLAYPLNKPVTIEPGDFRNSQLSVNLPDSGIVINASIVENELSKVYNTHSWFCEPSNLMVEKIDSDKVFIRAGSTKAINIMKTLADLKVPRDARDYLLTVSSGNRILWIPGVGHAEGFLSPKSYEAWCKDGNREVNELLKITFEREGENNG